MIVTDSQKASSAALLVVIAWGANLALFAFSSAVYWLAPASSLAESPLVFQLLWLGPMSVLALGLLRLSGAFCSPWAWE